MPNDHTDGSVVEGIVGFHVEEGILEDACREANFVGGWVVVGIDSLWGHVPFVAVNGFLPFACQHVGMCPFRHFLHVLIE